MDAGTLVKAPVPIVAQPEPNATILLGGFPTHAEARKSILAQR